MNGEAIPTRDMPEFEGGCNGGRLNRKFVPRATRRELFELLVGEAKLPKRRAAEFLAACVRLAQMALSDERDATFAEEHAQTLRIAKCAGDLLETMEHSCAESLRHVEACSVGEHNVLSRTWEAVAELERAARLAADAAYELRGEHRSRRVGAGLAQLIARAYAGRFGRLPPARQEGWFVDFMKRLGASLGVECGPRIVRAAIAEMRPTVTPPQHSADLA